MLQHFKEEEVVGDIARRSILGAILPGAMVHLLERRGICIYISTTPTILGCEEFTKVYLGNYDTPEAIWSREMRLFMIEKISVHLGSFPQRLNTNSKVLCVPLLYNNNCLIRPYISSYLFRQ